jgi:hypothetical protein
MNIAQRELTLDEIVAQLAQPVRAAAHTVYEVCGDAASRVLAVARSLTSKRRCA